MRKVLFTNIVQEKTDQILSVWVTIACISDF